ncbi:MAG TPA: peptidylprolyl isomerase [Phycisphaerales bacterium]|nr:peptidylprolyl isomerase [Phycisphaerales bacterium]
MCRTQHCIAGGLLLGIAAAWGAGCGGGSRGPTPFEGVERAEEYAAGSRGRAIGGQADSPPATIDGEPVEWEELRAPLSETAGAAVLEEIALGRLLDAEMTRRGLTVGQAELGQERRLLTEMLAVEGDTHATEQLLTRVRERRGLGPARFAELLRRNAMLRALVRDRVDVRTDQVELAWRVQHGERVRTRIIVTETEREAQTTRRELLQGAPDDLEFRFAALAEERSTDASAPRGGLVEPFSPDDPAYESSIRSAVASIEPGTVSPIVAIRTGFALVYLDERLPPDGTALEAAAPRLREELRIRQERLLMDQLAAELLAGARITAFDDALRWSQSAGED